MLSPSGRSGVAARCAGYLTPMARPERVSWTPAATTDRATRLLRRAVELARLGVRAVAGLAIVTAAAVAIAWLAWVVRRPPADASDWAARAVVLALGLAAPAVLGVFLRALLELADLPRRVRELPPELRSRVAELRARPGEREGRVGVVGALVRLARLVLEARETLSPYAVVSAALRPALLLAAVVAALVTVLEIPVAVVAAIVLLLT